MSKHRGNNIRVNTIEPVFEPNFTESVHCYRVQLTFMCYLHVEHSNEGRTKGGFLEKKVRLGCEILVNCHGHMLNFLRTYVKHGSAVNSVNMCILAQLPYEGKRIRYASDMTVPVGHFKMPGLASIYFPAYITILIDDVELRLRKLHLLAAD